MSNWEWGIWNDGTVQYFGNRYLGHSFLSSGDYQAIVNGGQVYTLVDDGTGQAAAVVHYGGVNRLLDVGTVSMQVQVGAAATPRWGGAFNLGNGNGDALSFSVDYASYGGTISPDGRLGLNSLASYSLSLNGGASFDRASLSQQNISGRLIQPASGSPAINGAAGEFHFANGTAVSLDGVFGVNLVPGAGLKR